MMEFGEALVTISIVTFDGDRWIEDCLRSILDQEYGTLELLVVDNGSRDRTVSIARSVLRDTDWASVEVVGENLGYAGGHNRALDRARGEFVCLLNQDAVLDPQFIRRAVAEFKARPKVASMQGLVLRLNQDGSRTDIIDTTGLVVMRSRRFMSRSQGEERASVKIHAGPVFGADGPTPVYRASSLRAARIGRPDGRTEILDEDFFLYHEDTDLAWRLRLMRWDAWFDPTMIAWHARGLGGPTDLGLASLARGRRAGDSARKALAWRNHHLIQMKNETGSLFLRDLPYILSRELGSWVLLILLGPTRRATVASLIRALPGARRKRRQVQRRRTAVASELAPWFQVDPTRYRPDALP